MNFQGLFSGFAALFLAIGAWFSSLTQPVIIQIPVSLPPAASTSAPSQSTVSASPAHAPSNASQDSQGRTSSTSAQSFSYPEGSAWMTSVPLGDSEYVTSGPKKGYIYVCHVAQGGGGAQGAPTWISGSVWYPAQKVAVEGSVSWPNAYYSMSVSGSSRIIKSNGLPTDHDTGTFPIQSSDPAYQFDRNPNSITTQNYDFALPASPAMLANPDCIFGQIGIMNDGVPLFDGFDAEYRDAVAHETQDGWEGHPDETGVYHDHGFELGPVKQSVSTVVGFAFDGYPITGSLLPDGNYLHTADLDECHGITSPIELDGKTVAMYHYVLTQDFPYSVSCFRGASHEPKPGAPSGQSGQSNQQNSEQGNQIGMNQSSQASGPPQGAGPQGGSPPAPPQAAIDACIDKSTGDACEVSNGPSGACAMIGTYFACRPQAQ